MERDVSSLSRTRLILFSDELKHLAEYPSFFIGYKRPHSPDTFFCGGGKRTATKLTRFAAQILLIRWVTLASTPAINADSTLKRKHFFKEIVGGDSEDS